MRSVRAGGRLLGAAGWAGWIGLAMALLACRPSAEAIADGDDPLAALAAPVESARYGGPFWTREAHRDSRTWRTAKALCGGRRGGELPNCHPVLLVARWELRLRSPGTGAPGYLPALPPLPALPAPPPPPPALHPGEPGRAGADLAALKAWEARLLARGRGAGAAGVGGPSDAGAGAGAWQAWAARVEGRGKGAGVAGVGGRR